MGNWFSRNNVPEWVLVVAVNTCLFQSDIKSKFLFHILKEALSHSLGDSPLQCIPLFDQIPFPSITATGNNPLLQWEISTCITTSPKYPDELEGTSRFAPASTEVSLSLLPIDSSRNHLKWAAHLALRGYCRMLLKVMFFSNCLPCQWVFCILRMVLDVLKPFPGFVSP